MVSSSLLNSSLSLSTTDWPNASSVSPDLVTPLVVPSSFDVFLSSFMASDPTFSLAYSSASSSVFLAPSSSFFDVSFVLELFSSSTTSSPLRLTATSSSAFEASSYNSFSVWLTDVVDNDSSFSSIFSSSFSSSSFSFASPTIWGVSFPPSSSFGAFISSSLTRLPSGCKTSPPSPIVFSYSSPTADEENEEEKVSPFSLFFSSGLCSCCSSDRESSSFTTSPPFDNDSDSDSPGIAVHSSGDISDVGFGFSPSSLSPLKASLSLSSFATTRFPSTFCSNDSDSDSLDIAVHSSGDISDVGFGFSPSSLSPLKASLSLSSFATTRFPSTFCSSSKIDALLLKASFVSSRDAGTSEESK